MLFIDEAKIYVRSGKGGDGCVSFRREKYIPKGGPDGGDGGDGGDVVLIGDDSMTTLLPLASFPHIRATNGRPGTGRSMHGANGADKVVSVPVGTTVYEQETDERVADIDRPGQRVVVARGGKGGLGNEHFKSATNQVPRESTEGEDWQERTLRLELKLLADVGLVGKPNAGKSTFLRAVSHATPRVADYPFTTLEPCLGIVELDVERRLVFADLPGLIEGAAQGAGLGHEFLRHIERTGVLVHLLEPQPMDGSDPAESYRAIRRELEQYSEELAAKPELIAISKIDLVPAEQRAAVATELAGRLGRPTSAVYAFSSATGEGVPALLEACWSSCRQRPAPGWKTGAAET